MEVGRIIGGKYRLQREVGACGAVWAGEDLTLGRTVVLHFMRASDGVDTTSGQFLGRAKSAARIKHRGVAQVFDFGIVEDGLVYWVREPVEGRPLADCMLTEHAWEMSEVVEFAIDCLDALEAVHQAGIAVADLSAENVLVVQQANERHPKLVELGIAKTGDGPSDLNRMGVILFQWLTGVVPVPGDANGGAAAQLKAARPDLGEDLVRVVARALSGHPQKQFRSAREMRDALAALSPLLTGASPVAKVASDWAVPNDPNGKDDELLEYAASASLDDDGEEVRLPLTGLGPFAEKRWMIAAAAVAVLVVMVPWLKSSNPGHVSAKSEQTSPPPLVSAAPARPEAPVMAAARPTPVAEQPKPAPVTPDATLAAAANAEVVRPPQHVAPEPEESVKVATDIRPPVAAQPEAHRRSGGHSAHHRASSSHAGASEARASAEPRTAKKRADEGFVRTLDF